MAGASGLGDHSAMLSVTAVQLDNAAAHGDIVFVA